MRGVIPPLVTPLKGRDKLDLDGLERLIARVIDGGVHGLFILGTTGEGPSLAYKLRNELIDSVCRYVGGRVPVLVSVTDTSFSESVNLARRAAEAGAQAAVLAPPYYFPAGQPELLEYVRHIAPELPLPIFLYNMPSHTKVSFALDTLERVIEMPKVVGLKDSSGDMVYFQRARQLLAGRPDFSLLMGPEELLAQAVFLGGHGGVGAGANLLPRLFVDLYNAAAAGNVERAEELQARVVELAAKIYTVGHHDSAVIKGLKCALSCLGICEDFMAEPFHRFRSGEREKIRRHLGELGISPPI